MSPKIVYTINRSFFSFSFFLPYATHQSIWSYHDFVMGLPLYTDDDDDDDDDDDSSELIWQKVMPKQREKNNFKHLRNLYSGNTRSWHTTTNNKQ